MAQEKRDEFLLRIYDSLLEKNTLDLEPYFDYDETYRQVTSVVLDKLVEPQVDNVSNLAEFIEQVVKSDPQIKNIEEDYWRRYSLPPSPF